jgi:hypothetical protein
MTAPFRVLSKKASRKESNSASLRFQLVDEAINDARHAVQDTNDTLASKERNIIKGDAVGVPDIDANALTRFRRTQHKLVLISIPLRRKHEVSQSLYLVRIRADYPKSYGRERLMFACIRQFVNSPERIIPSLVRLGRLKDCQDFLGEVWTHTVQSTLEIRGARGKRKGNIPEDLLFGDPMSNGNGVDGLIKRGSHIFDAISRYISKRARERTSFRLQFMDFVNAILVWFDDMLIWLAANKAINDSVEVPDMGLCAG